MKKSIVLFFATSVLLVLVGFFDSPWFALSVAMILLGAFGYLEKIVSFELSPKLRISLLIVFLCCSMALLINSALEKRESGRIKDDLVALRDYGEVATWGFNGGKYLGGGASVASPVENWQSGYVTSQDGRLSWKCSEAALTHYRSVIHDQPRYPYPYYLLALCLKKKGDESWRTYARDGISILEHTTRVSGHDRGQDDVLKRLQKLISEGDTP